jgi:hypothetical protein
MSADWKDRLKVVAKELNIKPAAKIVKKVQHSSNKKPTHGKAVKANTVAKAPVVEQAPKKPWYERHIANVNNAGRSASVIKVLGSIVNPELAERLTDIETLVKKVHERCATESKGNRNVVEARRNAETVINYLATVRGALKTRDIEADHLPEVSTQMQGYLRELKASLAKLGVAAQPMPVVESISGDAITHFAQSEIKLGREAQSNRNKPAFMIELPVVPIFDGIVTPEMLMQAGLPVEKMGGYPVLLRQRLIALRTEIVDKMDIDREVYLKRLIKRIEEHSAQNWTLVSDTGMANAKHAVFFYWIMPEKALNAMITTAKGSALREWGLAF